MSATYVSCAIHRGIVPREVTIPVDTPDGNLAQRRHVCGDCISRMNLPGSAWRRDAAARLKRRAAYAARSRDEAVALAMVVARAMYVCTDELLSPRRRVRRVALARQVLMYLCREAGWASEQIGAAIGRNHSTVIHGHRLVQRRIAASPAFARTIEEIRAACAAREIAT